MFAIWGILINSDEKYLQKIIEDLSMKYGGPKFVPHITIYGLVKVNFSKIEEIVNSSLRNVKKFALKKSGISYSEDIWKSVFIELKKSNGAIQIYQNFRSKLSKYAPYIWEPHISLLYKNIAETEKQKIIASLKIKNEFTVDRIAVMKFSENVEEWNIKKFYKL